jgi:ankyrin repeat protein
VNHLDQHGAPLLHRVVLAGDAALLRWFLDRGPKLDVRASLDGRTALIDAVYAHRSDLARILIESGADVNAKSRYGETALLWAAYQGDAAVVELLLSKKARLLPAAGKFDRRNPLHMACEEQHIEVVRLLMAAGADVNAVASTGETPLICAAMARHRGKTDDKTRALLALLLDGGADPNAQSKGGTSALYWCALCSMPRSVELLLRHGADPQLPQDNGETPLDAAKDPEVSALLKAAGAQGRAASDPVNLHKAIKKGDMDAFCAALDAGADPNGEKDKQPALLHAVACSRGEMVRILVARGCNLNGRGPQRWCALHYLSSKRSLHPPNLDIGAFLLAAGIKVDTKDKDGRTPLALAVARGDLEVMTLLLDHGADPNAAGGKARVTPLHHAAGGGQLAAARLLLERGASKGLEDRYGRTAFDAAKKWRDSNRELVELLRPE